MTFSNDCVIPTVLSTTTEVRLNSDAAIQTPDGINTIVEVAPYWVLIGAGSPDESYIGRFRLQSNDVSIEPARFMMSGLNTGDAGFTNIAAPILRAYSLNIPNAAGVNVSLYAAAMVTCTVEPKVGAMLTYSTTNTGPQTYWQTPESISTGGTTIDTRTTGGQITLTDAVEISSLNCVVTPTTAAASTHDVGEFEMQSSDFSVPFPYKFPIAPSYSGLSGAASQNTNPNGGSWVKYPSGQGIPTAQRCLVNTFYTNRDAKGAGSKFMGYVSFTK